MAMLYVRSRACVCVLTKHPSLVDGEWHDTSSLPAPWSVVCWAIQVLKVSGVLAVVCFGLYLAHGGKYSLSRESAHKNHTIWVEIAFMANVVIFMITGSICYDTMHQYFFARIGSGASAADAEPLSNNTNHSAAATAAAAAGHHHFNHSNHSRGLAAAAGAGGVGSGGGGSAWIEQVGLLPKPLFAEAWLVIEATQTND